MATRGTMRSSVFSLTYSGLKPKVRKRAGLLELFWTLVNGNVATVDLVLQLPIIIVLGNRTGPGWSQRSVFLRSLVVVVRMTINLSKLG